MRAFLALLIICAGLAAVAIYASAFIVHQNEQALVLRFGEPKRVVTSPGLNWKVPLVDSVEIYDKRILDLDSQPQEVTASDQKRLVVDSFARYRIVDPLKFYQTLRYEDGVRSRLGPIIDSTPARRGLPPRFPAEGPDSPAPCGNARSLARRSRGPGGTRAPTHRCVRALRLRARDPATLRICVGARAGARFARRARDHALRRARNGRGRRAPSRHDGTDRAARRARLNAASARTRAACQAEPRAPHRRWR